MRVVDEDVDWSTVESRMREKSGDLGKMLFFCLDAVLERPKPENSVYSHVFWSCQRRVLVSDSPESRRASGKGAGELTALVLRGLHAVATHKEGRERER